jgi:hypothetical protein
MDYSALPLTIAGMSGTIFAILGGVLLATAVSSRRDPRPGDQDADAGHGRRGAVPAPPRHRALPLRVSPPSETGQTRPRGSRALPPRPPPKRARCSSRPRGTGNRVDSLPPIPASPRCHNDESALADVVAGNAVRRSRWPASWRRGCCAVAPEQNGPPFRRSWSDAIRHFEWADSCRPRRAWRPNATAYATPCDRTRTQQNATKCDEIWPVPGPSWGILWIEAAVAVRGGPAAIGWRPGPASPAWISPPRSVAGGLS